MYRRREIPTVSIIWSTYDTFSRSFPCPICRKNRRRCYFWLRPARTAENFAVTRRKISAREIGESAICSVPFDNHRLNNIYIYGIYKCELVISVFFFFFPIPSDTHSRASSERFFPRHFRQSIAPISQLYARRWKNAPHVTIGLSIIVNVIPCLCLAPFFGLLKNRAGFPEVDFAKKKKKKKLFYSANYFLSRVRFAFLFVFDAAYELRHQNREYVGRIYFLKSLNQKIIRFFVALR